MEELILTVTESGPGMRAQGGQGPRVCPSPSSGFPVPCPYPTTLTASSGLSSPTCLRPRSPSCRMSAGCLDFHAEPGEEREQSSLARAAADARHLPSPNSEVKATSRSHSYGRPSSRSGVETACRDECSPAPQLTLRRPAPALRPRSAGARRAPKPPLPAARGTSPRTPPTGAGSLGAQGLAELQSQRPEEARAPQRAALR